MVKNAVRESKTEKKDKEFRDKEQFIFSNSKCHGGSTLPVTFEKISQKLRDKIKI